MLNSIVNTLRYYNTIIELAKLTDEELNHLSMTRADIIQEALKQYWKANGIVS